MAQESTLTTVECLTSAGDEHYGPRDPAMNEERLARVCALVADLEWEVRRYADDGRRLADLLQRVLVALDRQRGEPK